MHYVAKFSNICKQLFTCDFPQPLQANTGIVPLLDHKWLYKIFTIHHLLNIIACNINIKTTTTKLLFLTKYKQNKLYQVVMLATCIGQVSSSYLSHDIVIRSLWFLQSIEGHLSLALQI